MILPFLQLILFSNNYENGIVMDKKIDSTFIQSDKKIIIIFFGYFGCDDVCAPILYKLNNLYESKKLNDIRKDIDVLFVNLTPEVENSEPNLFAKYFNKNFKGIYLSKKEVLQIDRGFGVYFSKDLSDETELNHTDHIYLIQNKKNTKILKKIYSSHPLRMDAIINDIKNIYLENKED